MAKTKRKSAAQRRRARRRREKLLSRELGVSVAGGRLRGNGGYTYENPGPWGRAGQEIGNALGEWGGGELGATLGNPALGARLGKKAGGLLGGLAHYLGRLFGSGAYHVAMPPTKGLHANSMVPGPYTLPEGPLTQAKFQGDGDIVRIRKREFVGVITGQGDLAMRYDINVSPSDAHLAWMSSFSQHYEEFRVRGMVIEYQPTSSNYSANQALGAISAVQKFNPAEPWPTTRHELLNYEHSASWNPAQAAVFPVECAGRDGLLHKYFVTPEGELPAGSPIELYAQSSVSLFVQGQPNDGLELGYLYIAYDIELCGTKLPEQSAAREMANAVFRTTPVVSVDSPLSTPLVQCNTTNDVEINGQDISLPGPSFIGDEPRRYFISWFAAGSAPGTAAIANATVTPSYTNTALVVSGFPDSAGTYSNDHVVSPDGGVTAQYHSLNTVATVSAVDNAGAGSVRLSWTPTAGTWIGLITIVEVDDDFTLGPGTMPSFMHQPPSRPALRNGKVSVAELEAYLDMVSQRSVDSDDHVERIRTWAQSQQPLGGPSAQGYVRVDAPPRTAFPPPHPQS